MNVREMVEWLSKQNPEALVLLDSSGEPMPELKGVGTVNVGLTHGKQVRRYSVKRGRIPAVVLDYDINPR